MGLQTMMVTYFTGSTFNQIVSESINDIGAMVHEPCIDDNQDIYKYIKKNIVSMSALDCLILDTSVCINNDDEILAALEMIRTMYDSVRIVIFAPYRETGEKFLTECLGMGITNIINTDDFNELKTELVHCMRVGMTYREAAKFREYQPEKVSVKHSVKRAVYRRMIGLAGSESNIGTTHNAIVLANFFRKKGFLVALVECNASGAFEAIRDAYEESKFEEGYFTINGVDMYPAVDDERMLALQSRSYNVIIADFGAFNEEVKVAFERCEDRLIVTGAKPWELESLNVIFEKASRDVLGKYIFCFNFTHESDYEAIREGMGELKNVHFLKYLEDPFAEYAFSDGDVIFADILPEKPEEEEKKGLKSFFNRRK